VGEVSTGGTRDFVIERLGWTWSSCYAPPLFVWSSILSSMFIFILLLLIWSSSLRAGGRVEGTDAACALFLSRPPSPVITQTFTRFSCNLLTEESDDLLAVGKGQKYDHNYHAQLM
jgi:hypothetical protein